MGKNIVDNVIYFVIPSWDGGKVWFQDECPFFKRIKIGDRLYARTQLGEEDPNKMTFTEWEYPKQMTDEELDAFFEKLLKESAEKRRKNSQKD